MRRDMRQECRDRPSWRNWQTHQPEMLVIARSCRFKSGRRHQRLERCAAAEGPSLNVAMRTWRNWHTRWTQNPVTESSSLSVRTKILEKWPSGRRHSFAKGAKPAKAHHALLNKPPMVVTGSPSPPTRTSFSPVTISHSVRVSFPVWDVTLLPSGEKAAVVPRLGMVHVAARWRRSIAGWDRPSSRPRRLGCRVKGQAAIKVVNPILHLLACRPFGNAPVSG